MLIQLERKASMNEHPFTAFIELIRLDQSMRNAYDELERLKLSIQNDLVQRQELSNRLDQYTQHVHELKKSIRAFEIEMSDLDQKEKDKRYKMDHAASVKEYQPLKREVDNLKQLQNDVEAQLMSAWNKMELAQKEQAAQQIVFDKKNEEVVRSIAEKQEKIDQLQENINAMNKDRPSKEVGIPAEWLEKYTYMRMQIADPVVPLMRGGCGACFYSITEQELLRVKRKALIQCKGCFRLLYMAEVMDPQPSEATPQEKK